MKARICHLSLCSDSDGTWYCVDGVPFYNYRPEMDVNDPAYGIDREIDVCSAWNDEEKRCNLIPVNHGQKKTQSTIDRELNRGFNVR